MVAHDTSVSLFYFTLWGLVPNLFLGLVLHALVRKVRELGTTEYLRWVAAARYIVLPIVTLALWAVFCAGYLGFRVGSETQHLAVAVLVALSVQAAGVCLQVWDKKRMRKHNAAS